MIIVIIVKTSKDNSVDPGETPTPEPEPTRKDCTVDGVPLCVEEEHVPEDTCVVDFASIH